VGGFDPAFFDALVSKRFHQRPPGAAPVVPRCGGERLPRVESQVWNGSQLDRQARLEEITNIAGMMGKKFGIKFRVNANSISDSNDGDVTSYGWESAGGNEFVRQHTLDIGEMLHFGARFRTRPGKRKGDAGRKPKPGKASGGRGDRPVAANEEDGAFVSLAVQTSIL
jgi:hypothetical protein